MMMHQYRAVTSKKHHHQWRDLYSYLYTQNGTMKQSEEVDWSAIQCKLLSSSDGNNSKAILKKAFIKCNKRFGHFQHDLIQLNTPCELMKIVLGIWPEGAKTLSRYGELSLHLACLYHRPVEIIQLILEAYPDAASMKTQVDGDLPIHLYLRKEDEVQCCKTETATLLLDAYPDAVQGEDGAKILTLVCRQINCMQVNNNGAGADDNSGYVFRWHTFVLKVLQMRNCGGDNFHENFYDGTSISTNGEDELKFEDCFDEDCVLSKKVAALQF